MDRKAKTEEKIREYQKMSDAEIRFEMAQWKKYAPGWIAGEIVLEERIKEEQKKNNVSKEILTRAELMDAKLATLENVAQRSEFKTWSLWIAIIAILIGLAPHAKDFLSDETDSSEDDVEQEAAMVKESPIRGETVPQKKKPRSVENSVPPQPLPKPPQQLPSPK